MDVGGPYSGNTSIGGSACFFGYLKLATIEEAVRKRAEQQTAWITDASAGLSIGEKAPRESAQFLERAFVNPTFDHRLDEVLVLEMGLVSFLNCLYTS